MVLYDNRSRLIVNSLSLFLHPANKVVGIYLFFQILTFKAFFLKFSFGVYFLEKQLRLLKQNSYLNRFI
jgi:hypothetical protein